MKVKYIGKVVFNVDSKVLTPGEIYDISAKSVETFYMLFEKLQEPKVKVETKPEPKPETKPEPKAKAEQKSVTSK